MINRATLAQISRITTVNVVYITLCIKLSLCFLSILTTYHIAGGSKDVCVRSMQIYNDFVVVFICNIIYVI